MRARQGPFNGGERRKRRRVGLPLRVFIPFPQPQSDPFLLFLRSFLRMIDELSNDVRGRKYPDHIGKEQCLTPGKSLQVDPAPHLQSCVVGTFVKFSASWRALTVAVLLPSWITGTMETKGWSTR